MDPYDLARTRATNIRNSVDDPDIDTAELLRSAHKGRDWEAQGYDDWQSYVDAELARSLDSLPDTKLALVHHELTKTISNRLVVDKMLGIQHPEGTHDMAPKRAGKYQVARPLTPEEMKALEASIKEHGQILEPIVVDEDGNVIDGHHRQKIAQKLGIDCPTRVLAGLDEDQKVAAAKELNFNRRHLDTAERRQLVVNELLADPQQSNRLIARLVGASEGTVRNVRKELEASAQITQTTKSKGSDGVERSKPMNVTDIHVDETPATEPAEAPATEDEDELFSDDDAGTFDDDDEDTVTTEVTSALGALHEAKRQIDKAAQYLGDGAVALSAVQTALDAALIRVEAWTS